MMALPDLTLNKGQIILTQTVPYGIVLDNSAFQFGDVAIINDLSDRFTVGQKVLYDPAGSLRFNYDSVDYFLTTEDKIFFIDNSIVP